MLKVIRTLSILMVVIAFTACASTSNGPQTYRIATASVRSDATHLAGLDGVLRGQSNADGTACFWVGDGSTRIALFWPYGYKAIVPPLAVYDDKDMLVAVVGQRLTMTGGRLADDVHSIAGCPG